MSDYVADRTIFLTVVRAAGERSRARLLIDSIRSFGGNLSSCPVWVFEADAESVPCRALEDVDVDVLSLRMPDTVRHYYFADKVCACAQAEEMAPRGARSLVWIDPGCLIVRPPVLYDLDRGHDAAVRPVHIRNVGLSPEEPLDGFWKNVCATVGVDEIPSTVETFVDGQQIRSYFNSHAFAIDPSRRLMRRWLECFEALVCDRDYQGSHCSDERHRIFLHQAVWSAVLLAGIDSKRIRELPPEYNYPYNLHQSVPLGRRATALNDLVSFAYEGRPLDPEQIEDIDILEPLRSWLAARAARE